MDRRHDGRAAGRFPVFVRGIRRALFGTTSAEKEGTLSDSSNSTRRQRSTSHSSSSNEDDYDSFYGEPPAKKKMTRAACIRTDQQKLFDCFQSNDLFRVDKIKSMLSKGDGVELLEAQEMETGKTILALACSHKQYVASAELVRYLFCDLLQKEEDATKKKLVNIADHNGMTPLHHAAKAGNATALDLCLRFGADPTHKDRYGRSALHAACSGHYYYDETSGEIRVQKMAHRFKSRQLDCMDYAINANPKLLHEVDDNGRTPLFDCLKGVGGGISWDLTTFMLERGATLTVMDHQHQNLVHHVLKEVSHRILIDEKKQQQQEQQQRQDTMTNATGTYKKQDDRVVGGGYMLRPTTTSSSSPSLGDGRSPIPPKVLFETQILFRLLINLEPQLLSQRDGGGGSGGSPTAGLTPFQTVCFWGNIDLMFYFLKEHNAIRELLL